MKMSTNFDLMDELMVAPTRGLDGARGMVKIIAVTVFEGVPTYYAPEAYLTEDAAYDQELKACAWYGFRYLDAENDKDWGICYLPEELFQTMVDAAKN